MGIRKPSISVGEARRLADTRSAASAEFAGAEASRSAAPPQHLTPPSVPVNRLGTVRPTVPQSPPMSASSVSNQQVILAPGKSGVPTMRGSTELKLRPSILTIEPLPPPRPVKDQIFLMAPLPAQGVSPIFDMLCRQYAPSKALQMILRRALDIYEQMLADGSFQKAPRAYVTVDPNAVPSHIQTSRMLPQPLLSVARAHFDPLGLESTRVFGRRLAMSALAVFFSAEVA